MPKTNVSVKTDANGAFSRQDVFNPPGPFNVTVKLKATLITPADTTSSGTLEINSANDQIHNDPKSFELSTGKQESLGSFKLAGGDNIIVVSGKTTPVRPDTNVEIEIEASL